MELAASFLHPTWSRLTKLEVLPWSIPSGSTLSEKIDLVTLIMTREHDYMTSGKAEEGKVKNVSYSLS